MNILTVQNSFDDEVLNDIVESFTGAMIWQNESLYDYTHKALSYDAREKIEHTCRIFYSFVLSDSETLKEMIEHEIKDTGHDLALQLLSHGVGFWEQETTKNLNILLETLVNKKVLKPFDLYYDSDNDFINWDIV